MLDLISQNGELILFLAIAIFLFWNISLEIRLKRERERTTFFFKGEKIKDLEEIISEILKKGVSNEKKIENILSKVKKLDESTLYSIQKKGVIRFNPFDDVGGNQSFSLALLDQKDDGVVISSYSSKDSTRVYAKPIKHGNSRYPLSKEEEKVIKKIISS